MEKVVQVENLRKIFISQKKKLFRKTKKSEFIAVNGVSFDIYKGEIFGLLGPNGAGKTTIIKTIAGLLRPTSGNVKVKGIDVDKDTINALKNIGTVLAGDRSVYWKLTARENLEYFASLYGFSRKESKKRAAYILKRVNLESKADELVEKYSTGMKQRVALGKALVPDASVVLLDEPTLGLDPQAALNLRELILELKNEGKTVLLTTHYMEEADFLSDRIAVLDAGKIIALDTPENLKKNLKDIKSLNVEVDSMDNETLNKIEKIKNVKEVLSKYNNENKTYTLTIHHTEGKQIIQDIIDTVLNREIRIISMNVKEPSLEDVFIDLTGKSLRE